jgi:hypothetical protein
VGEVAAPARNTGEQPLYGGHRLTHARSFLGFVDVEPPADLLAKWMDPEAVAQVLIELIEEGPEGRSGDNIGLWMGHPTELPPPSGVLNVPRDLSPESVAQVLADAFR